MWLAPVLALGLSTSLSAAEFRVCNQTSYVLDTALAIEFKGATAARGWFRVFPGGCNTVLKGSWSAERYYLHTRTPAAYGEQPQARAAGRGFCVREQDFLLSGAAQCKDRDGRIVPFVEVMPEGVGETNTTTLYDAERFKPDEARIAGLQRLLDAAGYEPGAVDGVAGGQTDTALARFRERFAIPQGASDETLFAALLQAAARRGAGSGVNVCNDTAQDLLVAVGFRQRGRTITRGWYQLAPTACEKLVREATDGEDVFVYAESVDDLGRPLPAGAGRRWQGEEVLCTKAIRFEIDEQDGCREQGYDVTAFKRYSIGGEKGRTIRLGGQQ